MRGRSGAALVGAAAIAITVFLTVGGDPPAAEAAPMCPPITLADVAPAQPLPDQPSPSTTSTTSTTTTTTTVPPTSSTVPSESTTTTHPGEQDSPGTTTPPPPPCEPFVYDMTYPLTVKGRFLSRFGAPREGGTRLHKGVDLSAPKLTPVVASRAGTVIRVHNETGSEDCCWLAIRHGDGWQSWYIHLNNDNHGTDDGAGRGVRIDLEIGDPVKEGEVLGWLGDSGNAEETTIHIHYELRMPDGTPIDPRASLDEAARRVPWPGDIVYPYDDVEGALYTHSSYALAAMGIHWACDELGREFCPDLAVTPAELAWLAGALTGIDVPEFEGVYPPVPLRGEEDPADYLQEKILGCGKVDEECRDRGVTEAMIAQLAHGLSNHRHQELVAQDPAPPIEFVWPSTETAIRALEEPGIIGACHLPLDHSDLVGRAQAAYLLLWWTGVLPPETCVQPSDLTR